MKTSPSAMAVVHPMRAELEAELRWQDDGGRTFGQRRIDGILAVPAAPAAPRGPAPTPPAAPRRP